MENQNGKQEQEQMNYDVIAVGGGPAGIGAAYAAAGRGAKVLLHERSGRLCATAEQ